MLFLSSLARTYDSAKCSVLFLQYNVYINAMFNNIKSFLVTHEAASVINFLDTTLSLKINAAKRQTHRKQILLASCTALSVV